MRDFNKNEISLLRPFSDLLINVSYFYEENLPP